MGSYDYSKLLGRIVEKYGNNTTFANELGVSLHTLSYKLNNKIPFKQNEIEKSIELLSIPRFEIHEYFFKKNVQE